MPHRTTRAHLRTLPNSPVAWIKSRIAVLERLLFAATDAAARQHGWQVTSTRWGFGRSYRDPRFDSLNRADEPPSASTLPRGLG